MTAQPSTRTRGLGIIERWREWIDVTDNTPSITIGEGDTPLVHARRLGDQLGVELYLKLELCNPTGSFKDRGMCVAVARAIEDGAHTLICASTGNTSASAAAFAAAAGIRCIVVVPEGKIARGKLLQAQVAGATVVSIRGSFDDGLVAVRELAKRDGIALVNSVNPYRIEGQQTAAWEVVEQLGDVPDVLALPVGNAGNITAWARGFDRWRELGTTSSVPTLLGVQAAGAAPLVEGHEIEHPETIATAIRIGRPARGDEALEAVTRAGGQIRAATDEAIVSAVRRLASMSGVWCEPASAASIAGLAAALEDGTVSRGSRVVAVLTGHGLKDPDAPLGAFPLLSCGPDADDIATAVARSEEAAS